MLNLFSRQQREKKKKKPFGHLSTNYMNKKESAKDN